MRVKVTQLCYHSHKRRKIGDVFDLVPIKGKDKDGKDIVISPDQQFSKRYMVKVGKPSKKEPECEPEEEIEDELTDGDESGSQDQEVI